MFMRPGGPSVFGHLAINDSVSILDDISANCKLVRRFPLTPPDFPIPDSLWTF